MSANVWNQLALEAPEWLTQPAPDAPQESPRAWPPLLMRDYLAQSPTRALSVDLYTCLGSVIDFLAAERGNVVVVHDRGNLLGCLFEDWAEDAIREDGMQALDLPVAEIMEAAPWCCDATDSPYVVLTALQSRGLRQAPVLFRGKVVGTVDVDGLQRFLRTAD